MAKLAAIILIWGFAGAAVFGEEIQELQWHSSVTLQGTLEYSDFYGPPNYGETPEQDVVERIWMLALDQPIQVSGEVFDSSVSSTATDSTIQLLGLEKNGEAAAFVLSWKAKFYRLTRDIITNQF